MYLFDRLFRVFFPAQTPEDIQRQYNIPNSFHTKIRITNDGYFVLTCDELPGLVTEAKDGKQLLRMFNDALLTYYNVPRRVGDIVHNTLDIDGHGTFEIHSKHIALQSA